MSDEHPSLIAHSSAESAGSGDSYGPIRAVLLELLGALDDAAAGSPRAFYDRICGAVCDLTEVTRCALLLYDEREKRVLPAGSFGIDEEVVMQLHGTLDETPIAATALAEDRVIVSSELDAAIPARHRNLAGVETLACVPIAAGERWLGVMLCDHGGGAFDLAPAQQDLMWALGKTAALAASTRIAFAQHERAKLLAERVALAREVHDRVMQRLFGLSLVLGSGEALGPADQKRTADELHAALEDLRTAIQRTGEPPRSPPSETLTDEITRLIAYYPDLRFGVDRSAVDPPLIHEPLVQSVLAEALHNARKHASSPGVEISTTEQQGTFVLEVVNDGVTKQGNPVTGGMGLRLAAFDAIQRSGVLEFGPVEPSRWRVRLVLPLEPPGGGDV